MELLVPLVMHSLVGSCPCPDRGWKPRPWRIGTMREPAALRPGWREVTLYLRGEKLWALPLAVESQTSPRGPLCPGRGHSGSLGPGLGTGNVAEDSLGQVERCARPRRSGKTGGR